MNHAYILAWLASSVLATTPGDAEIVVLDPGGKPAANKPVRVIEVRPFPFVGRDAPKPQEVRTDAEGRARISLEIGLRRLNVRVPGIGFGGTGLFEVTGTQVARPNLPRLARFARVEGKVVAAIFQPGLKVACGYSAIRQPTADDVSVPCDAEGRFIFEEIVPGEIHLRLVQDQSRVATDRTSLVTEPGQTRRDVVLRPPPPPDPEEQLRQKETLDRLNWTKGKEEITWVEGTVRDTRGTSAENAEVMVKGVFYGGIRNYSDLQTVRTDARGHYRIRGPHANFQDAFTVVVRIPGRVPALAYARAPGWDDAGPPGPLDVTVPDRGGTLVVRVLRDGKPAANMLVALRELGFVERIWSRETDDQSALHKLFNPTVRTDGEGIARFPDLYPCRYELRASENQSGLADFAFPGSEAAARTVVPAVAVAAGEEVSMTVALRRDSGSVTLQALRPDGTPPGHRDIGFSFGLRETNAMSTMNFDANGIGTHRFADSGLWAVGLQFRDTVTGGLPTNWEPYYRGSTLLPISPAYPMESPVKLTCDRHSPGSIRARLVDLDGRPARGTVFLPTAPGPEQGTIERAASADEDGVAHFTDVTSGTYRIQGSMPAYAPPYLPFGDGPPPDDATLRNQVVFPVEQVEVKSGTETRVEVRPVKAGYVRGRISPAPGAKMSQYYPFPTHNFWSLRAYTRREPATGEYLCGPLLPGKVEVRLRRLVDGKTVQDIPRFVNVAAGDVARLDLDANGASAPSDNRQPTISLGMGGLSTRELPPEAMAGTVVHADGRTPAFGAQAVLMVPKERRPTASAITDAAGRLTWTGLWILRGNSSAAPNPPGQVTTPTVVVSVPGLAGASVIPIDPKNVQPFRAVLPPPLNATGRVTLGGQAITSQYARVRVIAGHQGSGVLDGPLSVEAIVEPDGRFMLRGLTPGTYHVQAARDGIWLSRSSTVKITPDEKPADLALDIPEPGAAVTLALVHDNNRPAGRRGLKLARPEGPFMDLWPEHFTTGADGTLTVRGLEVGVHPFSIDGEVAPRTLQVPRMTQAPARLVFIVQANSR